MTKKILLLWASGVLVIGAISIMIAGHFDMKHVVLTALVFLFIGGVKVVLVVLSEKPTETGNHDGK